MAFSAEDKAELTELVQTAMDEGFDRRRRKFAEEKAAQNENRVKKIKTYLITLPNRLAFADERGRAVIHDCFYANVEVNENGRASGLFEQVEVVAFGDGKLIEKPVRVTLAGMVSMVEIEDGFLESVK